MSGLSLGLSVTESSGVIVTYWKVSTMFIDNINLVIRCDIAGYLNQSAFVAGDAPVLTLSENMNSIQYAQIMGASNIILEFYTLLSAMPDFAGSTIGT